MTIRLSLTALLFLGALVSCSKRSEAPRPKSTAPATGPASGRAGNVAAAVAHPLRVGDPVPTIRLPAHDGRRISLADYRGKKILLWFYPKADTPG